MRSKISILLLIIVACFSCVTITNKRGKEKKSEKLLQLKDFTPLPLGNSLIKLNFSKKNLFEEGQLIDSIFKSLEKTISTETSECFLSKKNIEYHYYEINQLSKDSNIKYYEHLFHLPKIYNFDVYIDKVSKKCNNIEKLNLETQFCLSIYNKKEVFKRYNIGYIHYGDLAESTKHWFIDENYIIYTRIIGIVAEEDEEIENTYINVLYKYIITDKGHLIPYYNKEQFFNETKTEKGQVKKHTKVGTWIEKKYNYLVFEETYVEANYNKGVPIGKWDFYKLELVYDKEGNINYRESKKTDKLLMTEIYNSEGELIEREIYSQQ